MRLLLVLGALALSALFQNSPALADEPKTGCPENFDPDENAWVLMDITEADSKVHTRHTFVYVPDARDRFKKKFFPLRCLGYVGSFLVDGKWTRLWKETHDIRGRYAFLLQEDGQWRKGTEIRAGYKIEKDTGIFEIVLLEKENVVYRRQLYFRVSPKSGTAD